MSGPGAGGDLDRLLPVPEQTVGGGGSWTHVREHGSLQREQEASAVATGLVYNLCFLACE